MIIITEANGRIFILCRDLSAFLEMGSTLVFEWGPQTHWCYLSQKTLFIACLIVFNISRRRSCLTGRRGHRNKIILSLLARWQDRTMEVMNESETFNPEHGIKLRYASISHETLQWYSAQHLSLLLRALYPVLTYILVNSSKYYALLDFFFFLSSWPSECCIYCQQIAVAEL